MKKRQMTFAFVLGFALLFAAACVDTGDGPVVAPDTVAGAFTTEAVRYVDSTAAPRGDGKSWQTAFRTVEEALAAIESDADDQTADVEIWVTEGTPLPNDAVNKDGVTWIGGRPVFAGFAGTETSRAAIPLEAADPHFPIPDGDIPDFIKTSDIDDGFLRLENNANPYVYFDSSTATYTDWGIQDFQGKLKLIASGATNGLVMTTGDTYGRVGIGTDAPLARLHVQQIENDGTNATLRIQYGSSTTYMLADNNEIDVMGPGAKLYLNYNSENPTIINANGGYVGIGTTTPDNALDVNGTVRAKEIIVDAVWSDFVFSKGYDLMSLDEVAAYIGANKHLPGVPSAAEVAAGGVSLGDTQAILLQKIEELTLHAIEQNKQIQQLREQITARQ